MRNRIILYWHTLRHLTLCQLLGRFSRNVLPRIRPCQCRKQTGVLLSGSLNPETSWLYHDAWNNADSLDDGCFSFLQETVDLRRPIRWDVLNQSILWRFWLHSFNYIHLLTQDKQLEFCHEWIAANPIGSRPAWHPYPLSRRIINWCKTVLDDNEISQSLYDQANYLYKNLETHLGGNHLLENACALILAGCYFNGDHQADRWLQKGLLLFEKETQKQILADGWHYERSPMYHALMLEGYLDILNVLSDRREAFEFIDSTARRMLDALVSATRPDRQIVLLNDATEEIAPPTEKLVGYGRALLGYEPQYRESFPEAGYYAYRDEKLFIFIDGGEIGPEELPAHAHADIFSYELSLCGLPFVVDTGVYEYEEGKMRDYVRHTQAHNTVCVDGVSQAECWKSFRVARRYPPKEVSYERQYSVRTFHGIFDGYRYLIGDRIQHKRTIAIDPKANRVSIDDIIYGNGRHLVKSRIHLHPDVRSAVSGNSVKLSRDRISAKIKIDYGRLHSESAWYCPRMGMKIRNNVLVVADHKELPIRLRSIIEY